MKHNNSPKVYGREGGFSLVELLVSITIFLIITSAIYGLLRIGVISRNAINNRSETMTNARSAVNSVGKDVVNAGLGFSRVGGIVPDNFAGGHLGTPDDSGPVRDLLTGIIAGNDIAASNLSISGRRNDVIAFAAKDMQFNGGNPLTIVDAPVGAITDNSNVLKTAAGGCSNCQPHDLYLVESKDGKQAVVMATATDTESIVLGRTDPLGINQPVLGGTHQRSILTKCILGNTTNCFDYSTGVTAKRIFWISYSVDIDGTLIRTSYGNNTGAPAAEQIQRQPLAYNVQNFQVRYLLQDGTTSDDPSEGNQFPMKMNDVVQVELTITIKAEGNNQGVVSTELINVTSSFSTRNLKYGS